MTTADPPSAQPRVLRQGRAELVLADDAAVLSWRLHDDAIRELVGPAAPGAAIGFVDVEPYESRLDAVARTALRSDGGLVEVRDALVVAAEAVGRAEPGVVLARRVRGVDAALDVLHRVELPGVRWHALGRTVLGYRDDRKVTVDGGATALSATGLTTRLRAGVGTWSALTIAVDGHLPASTVIAQGESVP